MTLPSKRWQRRLAISLASAVCITAVGYGLMRAQFPELYSDSSVYSVTYDRPEGWTEVPPGPFTLFVFREPQGKGTMRASVNEVQSNHNPTPELDTNGIAEHYLNVTEKNMPEWKGERLPDIHAGSEPFSLIRRTKEGRTVYTAFCAKGNTTILVSLTGGGKQVANLDDLMPQFRKLVASFRLTKKNIQIDE